MKRMGVPRSTLLAFVSLCSLICLSQTQSRRPSTGSGLYSEIQMTTLSNNTIIPGTPLFAFSESSGLSCYSEGLANNVRQWYFPNGTQIPALSGEVLFVAHRIGRVELLIKQNQQFTAALEGVYTCRIPDKVLYIGIYTNSLFQASDGPVLNSPVTFQLLSPPTEYPPTFSLNCTTTMFPPTEISWSLDQSSLSIGGMYSVSQILRDTLTATYDSVLTVRGGLGGSYQCHVSNSRGSASRELVVYAPSSSPSIVHAVAIGNNSVRVTWAMVNNTAAYIVFYESDSSYDYMKSTQPNTTIEGLEAGVEYTITVQAFSDIPGPKSSATTITLNAPNPPTIMANTLSPNSIRVHWQLSAEVNGIEISYTPVPGSCDGIQAHRLLIEDEGITQYLLSGLQEYTEYSIAVRFRGTEGFGEFSPPIQRRTHADIPSGPPEMVSAIPRSETERRIDISWSEPNCIDVNDVRVTGYKVRYGLASASQRSVVDTDAATRTHTVRSALRVFLQYVVEVAVVNSEGVGPYSEPMRVVIVGAPGPVSVFRVEGDIVSARLEWEPPVEGDGHGHITEYQIRYRQQNSNNFLGSVIRVSSETTSYRVAGLLPGNSYVFQVQPHIELLSGESSKETVTTNVIDQIQGVTVTILNETAINVTWIQLNSNDVSSYVVYFSQFGRAKRKRQVTSSGREIFPSDTSWGIVRELMSGVEYQFQVVAVVIVSGVEREGNRSKVSDDSTVTLGGSGVGNLSSAIAGVVIAVLVILLLVVIVGMIIYLVWRRNRSGKLNLAVRSNTLELKRRPAPLPLPDFDNSPRIQSSKPVIQEYPRDTICLEGEKVVLYPKVVGTPPPTIAWYHDGCMVISDYAIELSDDGKLTFVCVELKHAGVYRFTVSNTAGSVQGQVTLYVHSESEANGSDGTLSPPNVESKKIHVSDFGSYVEKQHDNSNKGFRDEYYSLSTGEDGHEVKWALIPENKILNRFTNTVVYDDNRIKLKPIGGRADCQHDYINASYINGYFLSKKFIATQGPKENTIVDYWRMIWQLRCPTIVMITNIMEGTRPKCAQYWPDYGSTEYGPFRVALTDEIVYADYTIRTFLVTLTIKTQTPLKVMQYHFTTWPDHGVPEYATSMLAFHRKVFAEHKVSKGPMVVHCSAGVGRTGTFISIDTALQQAEIEDHVDIPAILTKLRSQRMKMVQTVDQYVFVHDALLESLICGTTEIQSQYLKATIQELFEVDSRTGKSGFESQFEVLQQVTPKVDDSLCPTALHYTAKNRLTTHLPTDRWRVVLKAEYPDYICASFVNGYKKKKSFIVTQGPMQNTCRDFWKMVYERNCPAIVMLSDLVENSQETCVKYWPSGGIEQYGEFAVSMQEEAVHDGFIERVFTVTDSKSGQATKVSQFQVFNWNDEGNIVNLSAAINVINSVTSIQKEGPLVLHCSDSVTRCGIFCAVANCIECCKTENSMDVFQVVKALRTQKPGAIPALQHYQMIHRMLLQYCKEASRQ